MDNRELILQAKREYKKAWREKRKEHLKEYDKKYREENKERIKEAHNRYWLKKAGLIWVG